MPPEDRRTFLEKLEPHDVIAMIVLIGCFVILPMGIPAAVSVMLPVVGFYFGRMSTRW